MRRIPYTIAREQRIIMNYHYFSVYIYMYIYIYVPVILVEFVRFYPCEVTLPLFQD